MILKKPVAVANVAATGFFMKSTQVIGDVMKGWNPFI
jgi:hypothetical protein